jgi:hypothetical protein
VEKFSVERLKDLTFTEVRLRYRDLQALTAFEGIED